MVFNLDDTFGLIGTILFFSFIINVIYKQIKNFDKKRIYLCQSLNIIDDPNHDHNSDYNHDSDNNSNHDSDHVSDHDSDHDFDHDTDHDFDHDTDHNSDKSE